MKLGHRRAPHCAAVRAQPRDLGIDWIDVEAGAATLLVSPSGESLPYDTGWEVCGRDAKRIAAAVQRAGYAGDRIPLKGVQVDIVASNGMHASGLKLT